MRGPAFGGHPGASCRCDTFRVGSALADGDGGGQACDWVSGGADALRGGRVECAMGSEYVLTKDFRGEHERLRLLESHVDPLSVAAIEAVGLSRGARCLEIGAGAGSIARWLAERVGDPGLVVATDLDT